MADNDKKIKLNKNLRIWRKYRGYFIAVAACVIVIVVCAIVFKSCNKDALDKSTQKDTVTETINTETQKQSENEETTTAQETTTAAQSSYDKYVISGQASEEEFTNEDAYAGTVILGDFIAEGIAAYHMLGDEHVVYDRNLNSSKAFEMVDTVLSVNPANVIIMVGINDANSDYSTETILGNILGLVDTFKQKNPDINVYVVSILPVTAEFESENSVRQEQLNDINAGLESGAPLHQATYIDAASSYMDESGYLLAAVTTNGCNIISNYYPFLMNGIAGALK